MEPQPIAAGVRDKGVNVLIDSSHDVRFTWMWRVRRAVRERLGYRVTGNQATLSTVLRPDPSVLMRDQRQHQSGTHRPFRWTPLRRRYQVVILYQAEARQPFLPEEVQALEGFMQSGGGVVIAMGSRRATDYPLRGLAEGWGVTIGGRGRPPVTGAELPWELWGIAAESSGSARTKGRRFHWEVPNRVKQIRALQIDERLGWRPLGTSADGKTVAARRAFGKGTLVCVADFCLLVNREQPMLAPFSDLLRVATGGQSPEVGPRTVPWERRGVGGAIFPEKHFGLAGVRVCYAGNQHPGVIRTVRERLPEVKEHLEQLIPSGSWSGEAFYVMLAAGSPGSGWAVNIYTPKSASATCDDMNPDSILSVAAHELAHTMKGPTASDGTRRAQWPPFWGEAHAGYFQRLVWVRMGLKKELPEWWFDKSLFPPHRGIDLSRDTGIKAWESAWWVWRQIDHKYREGWYPKWLQLVYERGMNQAQNVVTLDVMIETISQAVGSDVRPIFRRIR